MLHDALDSLELQPEPDYVITSDNLYADDTLLASQHPENLQFVLESIVTGGRKYGMEFNWDKTAQMKILSTGEVTNTNGRKYYIRQGSRIFGWAHILRWQS
eukprot:6684432-Pyramimonas_sp.AAC.1